MVEIQASELNDKLAYLAFGASKTASKLEYSDCVMFLGGKAYCFSGSSVAIVPLDLGFEGSVNYADLSEYARTSSYVNSSAIIRIETNGNKVVLGNNRSVTQLPYTPNVVLTLDTVANPLDDEWKPIPPGFNKAIKRCESVYTREIMSDNILSCIHVTGKCVEAATPEQAVRVQCTMDIPHEFLIKFGRVGRLFGAKFPTPEEYQICEKWMFFRSFDTVFGIPISRDKFVTLDRFFIPGDQEVVLPDAVSMDLPFFQRFYTQDGNSILLAFKGDHCELSIRARRGQHSVDIPMECPNGESYLVTPALLRTLAKYGKCSFTGNRVYIKTDDMDYAASVTREGEYAL